MEAILYSRLSTDTTLATLTGGRIFPDTPTSDTNLPYLTYSRTSTTAFYDLNGAVNLTTYEFQIDCWTVNADTCLAVADAVIARLSAWRVGTVKGSFLASRSQQEELFENGTVYHGTMTFMIFCT